MRTRTRTTRLVMAAITAGVLGGCAGRVRDERLVDLVARGDFTEARYLASSAAREDGGRSDGIDQARIVIASLGEGLPTAATNDAESLYKLLRTAGVNEGKEISTFVLTESAVRVYKGDPFEQAMSYHYIGLVDGLGDGRAPTDWGNLRAATNNALFSLRDVSNTAARAAEANKSAGEGEYAPVPSDFEIGYVMRAIAARQLGEMDEARTSVAQITQINPGLREYGQLILTAKYNTVLVVDFGLGPAKYATGTDGVIAARRTITASDNRSLMVKVGEHGGRYPVVTDVNRLANDTKWANLEDLRRAKSAIGTGLVIAGTTTAAASRDRTTQAAALGAAAFGALMKATSAADTRHVEIMPQRVYVALLNLPEGVSTIDLQIEGLPESRMVIPGVPGPGGAGARLMYARLPTYARSNWATLGGVVYENDFAESNACIDAPGTLAAALRPLPYILGGQCVRTPDQRALDAYHAAGVLSELSSVADLRELYRAEGIRIASEVKSQRVGTHLLEGGSWLYSPLPGSTGFVRLMCQPHAPYVAKSKAVRELAAKYAAAARPAVTPAPSPK